MPSIGPVDSVLVVPQTPMSSAQGGKMDSNKNKVERKTNIEVCVRLRPLEINNEASTGFFGKKDGNGNTQNKSGGGSGLPRPNSARKPPIPTNKGSPRRSMFGNKFGTKKKQQQQNQENVNAGAANGGNPIYAWDVVSKDTAAQSPQTDLVPGRTHMYTLDRVYGPNIHTQQVYKQSVQPLVHAAMEGYHTAVLAYGQTSTGKTFTMTGVPTSPGLIPMAIKDCFEYLNKEREYLLRVSYLEVYKEHIRDLLTDDTTIPVRLFDHKDNGLVIKGLKEQIVTSPQQVFDLLAQGEKRRQIGATAMNQHSSRSHVMVRIWIESRQIVNPVDSQATSSTGSLTSSNSSEDMPIQPRSNAYASATVRVSSLSLVDLAGSESVKLNGGSANRRSEGHYINKSLMTLGQVVYSLSENKKTAHIPYRDSKLTRLLQPSLSGNAQMVLICCISPNVQHIEESHNTFKFATRAKKIPQKASIQEISAGDDKTLLQTYRNEIEQLKQQLKDAQEQQQRLLIEKQQQASNPISTNASISSGLTFTTEDLTADADDDDEVLELVEAIQTMEKLILKSKSLAPETPESLLVDDDDDAANNNSEDDEALLIAMVDDHTNASTGNDNPFSSPIASMGTLSAVPRTPVREELTKDLHRIQGLLSSVMKKKHTNKMVAKKNNDADEIQNLREQLEQQEVATSLRNADSKFLQQQLEEKDDLLQEVYQILEQVEERQVELEAENAALRKEVQALKESQQTLQPQIPINGITTPNPDKSRRSSGIMKPHQSKLQRYYR